MTSQTISLLAATLISLPSFAWSPKVHSEQTRLAKGLIPRAMADFLDQHARAANEAAAINNNTPVPTPEDVEKQFDKIINISQNGRPAREIAVELAKLANMAQLLTDPSATRGLTSMRRVFSGYADENFDRLVAVREPLTAATGDLDPGPAIQTWSQTKYERYRTLLNYVNPDNGAKSGTWDLLSVPFAQMQLGFSAGVNATANLWIYAWRSVGGLWADQE
ncbi:MAG: hypothetical protein FWG12_00880 [Holophagaceae bacterium]|nr:hypothetical protein [Holophagaceae bacterium]